MTSGQTSDLEKNNTALVDGVLKGNRRALAQAITLVESTRFDHRDAADGLPRASVHENTAR